MLAETGVKVVVTAIVAIVMLIRWRSWLEPLLVVASLVLEAMSFITITTIVARPRPDLLRLDSSPVDSSFPSGHVAAAAAYSAIAVAIFWRTRTHWLRYTAVALAVLVPILVSLARMYRGMHFFTDVVMGVVLGGASVLVTALVLRHPAERRTTNDARRHHEPHDTMNLTT
ncbi:MAG: phosphatase PAP2 family protein, partial [Ilumatobacteraceae bacterium]|nr:phosphatase PAP2 family protein [Ilumatobacteraceae bacterium]